VDLLSEDLQNVLSYQCSVEKSGISHVTNCSSKGDAETKQQLSKLSTP